MVIAAVFISLFALVFTIGSFWWLHARRGSVVAAAPETYAFIRGPRLRLPLVLMNDGAVPLLVTDLRVHISGLGHFSWVTTRSTLRPSPDDEHTFATPFAIAGRDTRELITEFGEGGTWCPEPGAEHEIRVEGKVHSEDSWQLLVTFEWWAPPRTELMNTFITHRNLAPEDGGEGA